MKLLAKTNTEQWETTTKDELDVHIDTLEDCLDVLSNLIDNLLDKEVLKPEELSNIFNTYRTYTKVPS